MFLGGVGIELRSSKPGARCTGLTVVGNQVHDNTIQLEHD
jgi:hypothetical protein